MIDADYTAGDHELRDNDAYANAKYALTLRWLGEPGSPPRRLLNVGCGAGLFNQLAVEAGFVVEACEPDPDAHAAAVARGPVSVPIHLGGLFDAPLAPADIVVMHDVLEHIEDDHAAADRLAELVSPGGVAIVSVPALQKLFGLHDELLGHYRRYDRSSLRQVTEPRFAVARMRYFGFTLIPVTLLLSRVLRRPYPAEAAGSPTLFGKTFAALCRAESRVPTPLGTSLICELRPLSSPNPEGSLR